MMYGHEKSDRCVVPKKSANKAGWSPAAERMEERRLAKGSAERAVTRQTPSWESCDTSSREHADRQGPGLRPGFRPPPYPRQEPGAGKPHAGIRAGGGSKGPSLPRPS